MVSHAPPRPRSRSRRLRWSAAGLAIGLVLAACSDASSGTEVRSSASRAPMVRPATEAIVRANSALGTELYHQLARQGGNFAFSPYAASIALAQVGAGAAGVTTDQLDLVQHVTDQHQLEVGLNTVMQQVDSRDGDRQNDVRQGHVTVQIPVALWGQLGTHVNQPFLTQLARWFGTGMRLVDLRSDPQAAATTMNSWMAGQTSDQITQVVPPHQVTEATRLVSTTGVYLAAPWDQRFDVTRTRQSTFHQLDGHAEDATTMGITSARGLLYAAGSGWKAAMLPYLGRQLAMVLIVPDPGHFAQFESGFDGSQLQTVLDALAPTPLDLDMPRFQFTSQVDLAGDVAALGAPTLFDPAQARLPGITADEALWLAAVDQQSIISADEEGTQASAPTAVRPQPATVPGTVTLTVDRPFVVAVVDRASGEPLLLGRVVDPLS